MTRRYRLKDTHPVAQKVFRVYELMDELGVCVEVGGTGRMLLHVRDDNTIYEIEDIEGSDRPMAVFPPETEWKIIYERRPNMHSASVKMKNGDSFTGTIWTWRPKEGYFELTDDKSGDLLTLRFEDIESAVERGQRVGIDANGKVIVKDVDLLKRYEENK